MNVGLRRVARPALVVISFTLMFVGLWLGLTSQPPTAYVFTDHPRVALGPAIALLGFIIMLALIFTEGQHAH